MEIYLNTFRTINSIKFSLILVICCAVNDVTALMIVDDADDADDGYYADWPSDERKTERSAG